MYIYLYVNVYVCIIQLVHSCWCVNFALWMSIVQYSCYSFEGSLLVNKEIELDYAALKNYWIFMIDYAYEDF